MFDKRGKITEFALFLLLVFSTFHLLAQSPNNDLRQRYYEEGEKALAEGRYGDAQQAYEKLRELAPGTAEVHARLGLIYFQERMFEQAVASLHQALKLNPSLPKVDTLLAMSLSELGRYAEALPGLQKGFRQSTDPAVNRMCGLQLLRAYTALQRDSDAVEVTLKLTRLYPNDPEVLYQAGKVYGNLAYLSMHKLAQVAPNSVWKHEAAAEAFESQGALDTALFEYRQVLALDPHRPNIHYRIGRTLLARSRKNNSPQDVAEAAKEFEEALRQDPGNANAAYELALLHRNSGELDEAQKLFEVALKYYPNFEEAHLGLADLLAFEQKPGLALPHLQRAIALNSENEVSWYRLAQVERALGNAPEQQKALAEFQRLHGREATRQEAGSELFSPGEVTKQKLDPHASP
ncbi:MAG TPA: tetratricopeptide repeat protein [Terriglobia bacterium]|nr:tetratricopeptide repeat protein [Terriglobia bacterium]